MNTIEIKTSHGTYRGRAAESIVRRVYGRRAYVRWSADPNTPEAGLIVKDSPYGGAEVLAKLHWVEPVSGVSA